MTADTRRTARAIPWGLVGALALVAAVERSVAARRDDLATSTARIFERSMARSRTDRAIRADVLCLGDSVLKFGFAPRAFEPRAGRSAVNLATVGAPPAVALGMLERSVEAGARPKLVVVDFKPFLLGQGHGVDVETWARVAPTSEGLRLAWAARDPDYFARFAASRLLPSVRDRRALRGAIRSGLLGEASAAEGARLEILAGERNEAVNLGARLLAPNPPSDPDAPFANEGPNLRADWSCLPANRAMIDRFFRVAADHRVPVAWVLTPVHPRLQAGRDRLGIDAAYSRFVAEVAAHAPGSVTVVDARRLAIPADRFVDATHLDARGALILSGSLGDWCRAVGADPPGGEWATLPPSADRPEAGDRVEDMAESARRVRERGLARRDLDAPR